VRECDVLIVGGGPAGLFLGALLAQQGVDAVVLEQRREPSAHSRAIGLHPPALTALQLLNLSEPAVARGVQVTSGVCLSRRRELGRVTFERAWPEKPFVLTLPQHDTEDLLAQRLEELAPGSVQRGEEVLEIHDTGESVQATTRRSSTAPGTRADGGAVTTWRTRVLVGADGAHSRVRAHAGITTDAQPYPDTYLMGDFADTTGDSSTAAIYLEPHGVVESFPLPQGVRRWVAHTGGAVVAQPRPAMLAALIAQRTGVVVDPCSNTMISAFTVRRRLAQRMVTRRQVLIGDAAHEISPIGGQGMTLGWLDALALAPLVSDVLARPDIRPLQALACFRDFERVRLHAARRAARQAELNMALGRPVSSLAATARETLVKAVLSTPVRHQLAEAFTMRWA
jgi:2-polyprenyl-6-methoxyphenol hydroxylase-like FAD-dependent oxidoreductase